MEYKKYTFTSCNFFQILSICLWIKDEMKNVSAENGGLEIVCNEGLNEQCISMRTLSKESVLFRTCYGEKTYSSDYYSEMCEVIEQLLNKLTRAKDFDSCEYQPKFLALWLSRLLPAYLKTELDNVYLEDLLINGKNGFENMKCSEKVRALRGEIDIDLESPRLSNGIGQTNSSRLLQCLKEIKETSYPFRNQYIVLYNDDMKIKDGAHRAACLYYLHGNIQVPVRRLYFDWRLFCKDDYVFPFNEVKKKTKGTVNIVLYGAGMMGRIFADQLMKTEQTIENVLWVDKSYLDLKNEEIKSPNRISQVQYDFIVIAVKDEKIAIEIKDELIQKGIDDNKIIWKNYHRC